MKLVCRTPSLVLRHIFFESFELGRCDDLSVYFYFLEKVDYRNQDYRMWDLEMT